MRAGNFKIINKPQDLNKKSLKNNHYIKIKVDENKLISAFLIHYFYTKIGKLSLRSICTGITIPTMSI